MKRYLFILLLFIGSIANAETYYVSSSDGDNGDSGLTTALAWATITYVNTQAPSPGDSVLFKRGDVWYETLTIDNSGTSGNEIYYGDYGTGALPTISGFTVLTSWTSDGSNIYHKAITSETNPNVFVFDDENRPKGRFPYMSQYYNWPSDVPIGESWSSTTVDDDEMGALGFPSDLGDAGVEAEIVARIHQGGNGVGQISGISGTVITFSGMDQPPDGYGYFLQNHIDFLVQDGDWAIIDDVIYIYCADSPTNHVIASASRDEAVIVDNVDYIIIENLRIEGANYANLTITGCDYVDVNNCEIQYSGEYGVLANSSSTHITIDESNISDSNDIGIFADDCSYTTISNDTITRSGYSIGLGKPGWDNMIGVHLEADYSQITRSRITHCGYDGIRWAGEDMDISWNFLDSICLNAGDGGGMYSYRGREHGKEIKHNIIMHVTSQPYGLGNGVDEEDWTGANGIYTDGDDLVTIDSNSIAFCGGHGLFINSCQEATVTNNTVFNAAMGILVFSESAPVDGRARGHVINDNILVTGNFTNNMNRSYDRAFTMTLASKLGAADLPLFTDPYSDQTYRQGSIDDNKHAYPIVIDGNTDSYIMNIDEAWGGGYNYYNLAGFESKFDGDGDYGESSTASDYSASSMDELFFKYNDTFVDKNFTATPSTGVMEDIDGTTVTTFTLTPFTSKVIFGDGTVTEDAGILVTNITVSGAGAATTITVDNGSLVMQSATLPTNASNPNHVWTVTNGTGSATIADSTITAVTDGTVTVRATASDGSEVYDDEVITISNQVAVTAPTVTTATPTYTSVNAAVGGNVTGDGGSSVTTRGVCYSTSETPTTSDNIVPAGSGTGAFTCVLSWLSSNTLYYIRAYATNSEGTSYGSQESFTTSVQTINMRGNKFIMINDKISITK